MSIMQYSKIHDIVSRLEDSLDFHVYQCKQNFELASAISDVT